MPARPGIALEIKSLLVMRWLRQWQKFLAYYCFYFISTKFVYLCDMQSCYVNQLEIAQKFGALKWIHLIGSSLMLIAVLKVVEIYF